MFLNVRLAKVGVLCAISLVPAAALPQSPFDFLQSYIGQKFLVREHGGLHEVVKIKKDQVEDYKGICDKAVEVKAVRFAKGVLQFDVEDIGMVLPRGNTPQECVRADETLITRLVISDFSGQEDQNALENVIGHVLQTPEAYLISHGVALFTPEDDPQPPGFRNWRRKAASRLLLTSK